MLNLPNSCGCLINAKSILAAVVTVLLLPVNLSATSETLAVRAIAIPTNFPHIEIGGRPEDSIAIRDLFWQHYSPSPKATLWDEWLLPPALWPANRADDATAAWRRTLSERHIDPDGYIATHQHHSIAHQRGWPFPFWNQGAGGFGWHFSFHKTVGLGWRSEAISNPEEWQTTGTESLGIQEEGWALRLTSPRAAISAPALKSDPHEAPFVQLRWRADKLPAMAAPYLEWTTDVNREFSSERRFYFDPPATSTVVYTMIPVYRHPEWINTITGLRLAFDNGSTGAVVTVQGLFAQYDTRHDINNPSFVTACIDYFNWTGDLNFLRQNIERMRLAMRYMESEFGTDKDGIVTVPWVGHEGLTGVHRNADGSPKPQTGQGVGNNYWDLLPFGKQDSYATIRHYGAALKMAGIEETIANNPGWNIAPSPLARSAGHWRGQAGKSKENGNRLFWNEATGRFTLGINSNGNQADYGYTFLNLEAIYYDFATSDHAHSILDWIDGRRTVSSDTSQTTDIYHWRFAPRASTLRNISHYGWFWHGADSIKFGDQVQDGGAVLGFSYHDVMARLKTAGPDDAANRLHAILTWYREVMDEGGYRAYYDGKKRTGSLQGGGPPGGLGMDQEFFESVLVPQVMIEGFLGFKPSADGISIKPNLPTSWPSLTIDNIKVQGRTISVTATSDTLTVSESKKENPHFVASPTLQVDVKHGWYEEKTESQADETAANKTRLWRRH